MSRKKNLRTSRVKPDERHQSILVSKFITRMMLHGKKSTSARILYQALDLLTERIGSEPLPALNKALENILPLYEVKSRRVGGATYQVPIEIRESRREALAMRWLIQAARERKGKDMAGALGLELIDAYNSTGRAFKKKEDTHRMAEANKAFSHFRW